MPFYKKAYNSKQKVHYPRAIVQGKPVETEDTTPGDGGDGGEGDRPEIE